MGNVCAAQEAEPSDENTWEPQPQPPTEKIGADHLMDYVHVEQSKQLAMIGAMVIRLP